MAREDEIVHLKEGNVSITPDGGSIAALDVESCGFKPEVELADATGSKSNGFRTYVAGLKNAMVSMVVIFRIDENPFEAARNMFVGAKASLKLEEYDSGGYWTCPVIVKSFDKPIFANEEVRKIPYECQVNGAFTYTEAV